jgi:hypothetical protein
MPAQADAIMSLATGYGIYAVAYRHEVPIWVE